MYTKTIKMNVMPDLTEFQELYTVIGWNSKSQRNIENLRESLIKSLHFVCVYIENKLVGFARILGDPFVAQLLDVITHPSYRRQGIGTLAVKTLLNEISKTHECVTIIDGSQIEGFYERFGFTQANIHTDKLLYLNFRG